MHNKTNRFIQWLKYNEFRLIGLTFLLSVILGYIGFHQYYERAHEDVNALQLLYLSFQLLVMESGAVDRPDLVPVALHIARWLAPAVLAYAVFKTIFSVLSKEIYSLKLRNYKEHVIICGLGEKGQRLADSFYERGDKIVIIEKDSHNNLINHNKSRGIVVLNGNALDTTILKKVRVNQAKYLIAVTGNDTANVELLTLVREIKNKRPHNVFLTCFAHIQDSKLKSLLYDNDLFYETHDNYDARIFNIYDNIARIALKNYAPDKYCKVIDKSDPPPHILILGCGNLGEAILMQIARVAHYINDKRTILTVIDEKAKEYRSKLRIRIPKIREICNVRFIEKDPELLTRTFLTKLQSKQPFSIIYYCLENDTTEIDTLKRFKTILPNSKAVSVIFTNPNTPLPNSLKEDKKIFSIELIHEACSADVVVEEELDKFAALIHEDYLKRAKENYKELVEQFKQEGWDTPKPKPIMVEWNKLNEEYRDNNRSQADHIDVKLRAIECEACPLNDKRNEYDFTSNKELMTALAKMEHRRWNANRWLAGWRLGKRNDELKTHPDLLPWEDLDKETQDYDIKAVANIPHLLKENNEKVCKDNQARN